MKNSTKTTKTTKTASAQTKLNFELTDNKKINAIRYDSFTVAYIFNRTRTKVLDLHYCVSKHVIDELSKIAIVTINKNFDENDIDKDAFKYDVRYDISAHSTVCAKLIELLNSDTATAKYIDSINALRAQKSQQAQTANAQKSQSDTAKHSAQTAQTKSKRTAQKQTASKTDSKAKTASTAKSQKRTDSAEAKTVA